MQSKHQQSLEKYVTCIHINMLHNKKQTYLIPIFVQVYRLKCLLLGIMSLFGSKPEQIGIWKS